jgi:hypothetical protein
VQWKCVKSLVGGVDVMVYISVVLLILSESYLKFNVHACDLLLLSVIYAMSIQLFAFISL